MRAEVQQLEAAIAAFEAQRSVVGDAMVEMAVAPLRAKLAVLTSSAAAAAIAEASQVLRQVSILFLDVVGSTKLSQRLDPEEVSAVLDGALQRGTAIVEKHAGKVLQYAGDNMLAVFGADETREDDTECAVRCGLALLELGKALGNEVRTAHGHDGFDVRVGIHTGAVLLGGGVDADGSIRGMAVNIAARMEQAAPPGALRISRDTYAQVRGMFEVEAEERLAVKGVDEPVSTYVVRRAKPRSLRTRTRGIEGVATRMVGRQAELTVLKDAFVRLFAERRYSAVTVVADAGIGKSRLLDEFEAWTEAHPDRFYLFRGRASPQTQSQPFGLVRDVLAWRFQIADDDTVEAAKAKLEAGVVPLFEPEDGHDMAQGNAHLLGHLIGIPWRDSQHVRGIVDDPGQIRSRALHVAARLFRQVAAGLAAHGDDTGGAAPIVLVLEDLHWADNESLEFFARLGDLDADVPLLLLAFTRPTLFERGDAWRDAARRERRITLEPLDKAQSLALADELLKQVQEVPEALRTLITRGSDGNPFYMEELVKMLIDQGAIEVGAEAWTLRADRLVAAKVPSTLSGVLQARLDGLPVAERVALQEASVIGAVFWDQALFALDAQARDVLPALAGRELVLPRADAALEGLREYAFRHQMLHQVTYETLLKRVRRELHGKVAQWLSQLGGLRAGDFLAATAEHYERAGETANAAAFHARAAEHARERFGHEATLEHVRRALALLDTDPDGGDNVLRWELHRIREQTFDLQARRAEQLADIDVLDALADTLDSDERRAHAALRRSWRALRIADWLTCESAGRRAMESAERAADHGVRLRGLRLLASALAMQGDLEGGKALTQSGLAEARARGLRANEESLLNTLIVIANLEGDVMGNLELSRQSVHINREIGDRRAEAVALSNLGVAWLELGELEQAERYAQEALPMLRANGDRVIEGSALCTLSDAALLRGDAAAALRFAESALEILVASHARDREVDALLKRGQAELALGRTADARATFARMRQLAREIESVWQHDATAGLAQVALAEGDDATALREIEVLEAHVSSGGSLVGTVKSRLIELTCHRGLARTHDPRAGAWLERAHEGLHAQAATISDASLRRHFLEDIPYHSEIATAWAAWHDQPPAPA